MERNPEFCTTSSPTRFIITSSLSTGTRTISSMPIGAAAGALTGKAEPGPGPASCAAPGCCSGSAPSASTDSTLTWSMSTCRRSWAGERELSINTWKRKSSSRMRRSSRGGLISTTFPTSSSLLRMSRPRR